MNETLRPVLGFEGIYSIGKDGAVVSCRKRELKILRPFKTKIGYIGVVFNVGGKQYHRLVHRMVYESFSGKIPDGFEVNHRDRNKLNNHIDNLELMSHSENLRYHYRGTRRPRGHKKSKHQGYFSAIQIHGKTIYLGYFPNIEMAQGCFYMAYELIHGMAPWDI